MLNKEEIEKANRICKRRINELKLNYAITNEDLKAIEILLQYQNQLEKENNKQNKMIDEMASYISNLDVDEDICKKVKISHCADETSVPASYCIECIKQYFEKKVGKIKCVNYVNNIK